MVEAEIQLKHGPEFRRCLVELDVQGMRDLWKHCAPHLSHADDKGTLYAMHLARTNMETLPQHLKDYSQRWLNERGAGSFMSNDKKGH